MAKKTTIISTVRKDGRAEYYSLIRGKLAIRWEERLGNNTCANQSERATRKLAPIL